MGLVSVLSLPIELWQVMLGIGGANMKERKTHVSLE